jgi:hypothetical protein
LDCGSTSCRSFRRRVAAGRDFVDPRIGGVASRDIWTPLGGVSLCISMRYWNSFARPWGRLTMREFGREYRRGKHDIRRMPSALERHHSACATGELCP